MARSQRHLEVVAAADVLLVDPDLRDGGAVGRQGRHRLPQRRSVGLLQHETRKTKTDRRNDPREAVRTHYRVALLDFSSRSIPSSARANPTL